MTADLKAAAQQAFNLLDRLPINEGYHDETVDVLDALRAGLAAQAPAEGDALALALEQGMRDLAACAIEAETGREATSEWIDAAIKLAKPGTPLGRMRDALTAHRAAAAAIGAPRLTEQEKTVIVRNWFADDWAIESALGMLHDYDLAVKRSKPQPKGTAASVPEWKREARQAAEGKQAYYRDMMRQAREAREDAQAPAPVAGLVRRGFLLQWPTANGRRPVWSDTDAAAKAIGCPVEALFALDAQAPAVGAEDAHAFKNFHRLLCERFGYGHDDKDWRRDQLSLIEFIAAKVAVAHQPLDIDDLKDRLVAASAAVADQDDRSAQAILGETLKLLNKEAP